MNMLYLDSQLLPIINPIMEPSLSGSNTPIDESKNQSQLLQMICPRIPHHHFEIEGDIPNEDESRNVKEALRS